MFSDKLKELRKKNKLTQGELANRLNISASTVGMYEQNRRSPDTATLNRIAEFFGVSVGFLADENTGDDFESTLQRFKNDLMCADGLMFKGVPLTEEDRKKLSDAIEISARIALEQRSAEK